MNTSYHILFKNLSTLIMRNLYESSSFHNRNHEYEDIRMNPSSCSLEEDDNNDYHAPIAFQDRNNNPINNYYCTDSIGDTITVIKEGTGIKEYSCLRKAFLFFIISFKVNSTTTIKEASNILYQFFHNYPTIVGWFFLLTKMKRVLFSMFDGVGESDNSINDDSMDSIPTKSYTFSRDEVNSNHFRNNIFIKHHHIEQNRNTEPDYHESQIHYQQNSKLTSSTSNNTSCMQNAIDTNIMITSQNNKTLKTNNSLSSKYYNEARKRKSTEAQSSWGHFVDCATVDEDEIRDDTFSQSISTCENDNISSNDNHSSDIIEDEFCQGDDYGHFVDVGTIIISDSGSNERKHNIDHYLQATCNLHRTNKIVLNQRSKKNSE